jgi:hypothetical protein
VDLSLVLFDADDWSRARDVTVTAIDDEVAEEIHEGTIRHSASSLDPTYNDLDPVDVKVTIADNDVAGIQVSPTALTVSEPDGTAAFTVTLLSEPMWDVNLPLDPSNSECSVSPKEITLDSGNWQTGTSATVSARDDEDIDGQTTCVIDIGSPDTKDPIYGELEPEDVSVTVEDDERVLIFLPQMIRIWPPRPVAPTLQEIDNADGDGDFTVGWDDVPWASVYVLEQAPTPLFNNSSPVYEGLATSHQVRDFGASRRYFRVKARNSSGDSNWSNVQQVDVVWHLEGRDAEDVERQANGPIVPALTYYGRISDAQDVSDYYYFELPTARDVALDLGNIPAGQNYDLALRDRNLNTQEGWYSTRSGNRDEHVSVTLFAGRYYVQVYSGGGGGASQPYHLQVHY